MPLGPLHLIRIMPAKGRINLHTQIPRRVEVRGAGIIGLSVGYELLRRGHQVSVIDPDPGTGASYAAAGMLSPAGELWHGETELFDLGLASARLWPKFAEHLGVRVHDTGSLLVGVDAGDIGQVERHCSLMQRSGAQVQPLVGSEVAAAEPHLGRNLGGALLPQDHSVDPREVLKALLDRVPVSAEPAGEAPDITVLATGARLDLGEIVHPVRGDIVRVRTAHPPQRTIRAWVHGEPVYLVPRVSSDGVADVVIGATSEERDGPQQATVEGVSRLLLAARTLMPSLDVANIHEITSRDRPGTADNLPLIGPTNDPRVVLAGGHYRSGVLLAPLTANIIADYFDDPSSLPSAVDPRRFGSLL